MGICEALGWVPSGGAGERIRVSKAVPAPVPRRITIGAWPISGRGCLIHSG